MGVPVSGKNMFPSNIAGLPTWYTIRANKHGYIGRKKEVDFLVAMNPETAKEDVLTLEPGAAVRLRRAAEAERAAHRPHLLSGAVRQARRRVCPDAKLRRLVRNMIYDGVLVEAARHRSGADGAGAQPPAREEAEGRRAEHGGARGRLRLTPRQNLHQAGSVLASSR